MRCSMIALLVTIWALPAPSESSVLTTNLANFLFVHNGVYDDRKQNEKDKTHDLIQLRSFSAANPAFPDRHLMLNEYSFNGTVFNLHFCDMTEDSDGVVHAAIFNFTDDPSKYKPGEFTVDDFAKVTPQDLHAPSTCEAEFEPDGREFYGTYPACRHLIHGKPALYSGLESCDIIRVVVPQSASEDASAMPYNLVRRGDKFPVPDLPDGFVSPCN